MLDKINIEEMDEGKSKELLKIVKSDAKPFIRKVDGYAAKADEDKEITYTDHNNAELTLKVPKGSYVVVTGNCEYPEIQTADEFEGKNKFIEEVKPKKKVKKSEPKIGLESMMDE